MVLLDNLFYSKQPLFVLSTTRAKKEFYLHSSQKQDCIASLSSLLYHSGLESANAIPQDILQKCFTLFDFSCNNKNTDTDFLLPSVLTIHELFLKITYSYDVFLPKNMRDFFILQALHNVKRNKKITTNNSFLTFDESFSTFLEFSSILLSFYDELIAHKIPITLTNLLKFCEIDTYDEYANQLEFLAEIYSEYQILLESNGLRDSLYSHTIKQNYKISTQFLESFSAVYIELEGFITPLQYEILEQAAKSVAIFLYFTTDLYNISNFTILQQPLEIHRKYIYGIHNKKLLCIKDTLVDVNTINLYKTQKSFNQANLAIFLAYKWQQQILNNEASENDFALILPNESFCNHLITLDSGNLFNFAMGIPVTSLEEYNVLEKIYMYFLEHKIFCIEVLMQYIQSSAPIKQTGHLDTVLSMCLPNSYIIENPQLEQLEDILRILFESYTTLLTQGITILAELKLVAQKSFFSIRELNFEQLFILFMRDFSTLKKDDIHGGKIRVMGTLEARNLSFKEVLILDFTDDYIPNVAHEDVFLNSKIRSFYGMPTRQDKENIYKHHYYNIIKNSQIIHICYVMNHEKMPSNMLLELHCNLEDSQNIDQHYTYYDESKSYIPYFYDEEYPTFHDSACQISATSLNVYKDCVRQFYFRYIENLIDEDTQTTNTSIGLLIHEWLRIAYGDFLKKELTLQDMQIIENTFFQQYNNFSNDFLQQSGRNEDFGIDIATYIELDSVIMAMRNFFAYEKQRVQSQTIRILALEEHFELSIHNHTCTGCIDRIDMVEDKIIIIDYKTGNTTPSKKDLQMPFYYFCAANMEFFNPYKDYDIQCAYYMVKSATLKFLPQSQLLHGHKEIMKIIQTFGKNNKMTDIISICAKCNYAILCNKA